MKRAGELSNVSLRVCSRAGPGAKVSGLCPAGLKAPSSPVCLQLQPDHIGHNTTNMNSYHVLIICYVPGTKLRF